jgi:replicative DNA helicase
MSHTEQLLLSKVIDENNFYALNRYNITENDFTTNTGVYNFIKGYVKENGTTPDYRTVVAEFENFEYFPEVNDQFKYLAKQLKDATAKRMMFEVLQNKASENFSKMKGSEFAKWLQEETSRIVDISDAKSSLGTNFATNGHERWSWYEESKINGSDQFIPTPYSMLNEWLAGGFGLGDYVLLMAYTNRGKSWVASDMGLASWRAGFGVIHYSPELSKRQQLDRLDTLNGHFNNIALRNGELTNEEKYRKYLEQFNDSNEVPYIVKTMEDMQYGLSVETIEADLNMYPECKMVVIDGFNLMSHKGRDGNRNNMSNTSRQLRQLFGKYGVVGLVVHQTPTSAEKENMNSDETGIRVPEPPRIDQYSETVAVIQDACTVLTFDQHDGLGALAIRKARQPHVNKVVDLQCNFNMGYITEKPETFDF